MLIFQPPVNFCSDENIQTIFGTKLEDFLNYRIDYNSISQTVLIEIPVFSHTAFYGTFRSAVFFHSNFLCLLRWCDGAPGHFPRPPTPIPPHIHRHTQQHLYTHGRIFRTGLEPVLTSRWWPEECWFFLPPPYRQPRGDIHAHPWPGGGSFLWKNPPPSVGFEPTSIGTATSEYFLRQPCGHRATSNQ
jgi:hypothetical protein